MEHNQAKVVADQMRHTPGPGTAQLVHTIGSLTDSLSNLKELSGESRPQQQAIDDLRHSLRDAIAHDRFLDFRREFYERYDMSRNF